MLLHPLDEEYLDKLNIFCGDSLKNDLSEVFGVDKFDYIIGNPPYIGHKNLDSDYKKYILKEYKAPSSIILMTAALVEKKEDGILSLRLNNKNYSLKFNPNQLSAMIEEVEHNDASIKNMWGKVYRIKLQINSQELHNRVTYSLSEIPNNKI